ncbi:ES1 protein homolog, mitochondrial-like [Cephus cinctus]|uniref:ES1 protein homolog, mitochondrial-like n=1 Tax=Cephus cinctus TaxID=211228 RepID=A0AAJ7RNZ6_CEPCN|nr:ES1 protein homolog, mitochondrial-like [Cephus cinctus]
MLRSRIVPILRTGPYRFSVISCNLHSSVTRSRKRESRRSDCEQQTVAIILCGCGALDGTEISESISATIHCCQKDLRLKFFAPNIDICGVTDHLTKELDSCGVPRNALVEGARLARSKISSLCECKACEADALIIPGGFGAARTLSDFASKGEDCTLLPDLERVIEEFSCDKKPIGTICIAAALVAKVLQGVKITLGKDKPKEMWPYAAAIPKVKKMGAKIEMKDVRQFTRCKKYNVFSTPAWMYKGTYSDIHEGIGKMVTAMKKSMK